MTLTFKYDTPINDYTEIPAGTKVTRYSNWNEYEGFTAVVYEGNIYYFADQNFEEVALLSKLNEKETVLTV